MMMRRQRFVHLSLEVVPGETHKVKMPVDGPLESDAADRKAVEPELRFNCQSLFGPGELECVEGNKYRWTKT